MSESEKLKQLEADNERLQNWINDLQSGMYINCVYCGHQYGPDTEVPASMADVLKEHVEKCPEHPMAKLRTNAEEILVAGLQRIGPPWKAEAQRVLEEWRSIYGEKQ